jgi:hypothetical protein
MHLRGLGIGGLPVRDILFFIMLEVAQLACTPSRQRRGEKVVPARV